MVAAPAKLTLSLRITGVRADGYHLLDAEMVTLDLADTLTIDPSGDGITVGGPYAAGVPTDGSNLVARALARRGAPAAVHVDKRIPHGGGLGGGSADAAAVLRWAGYDDLVAAAARSGADVPFCLVGGRARVRGIGEIVEPLPVRAARRHAGRAAAARQHAGRLPGVGRPRWTDGATAPTTSNRRRLVVEPALATWRDRIARAVRHRRRSSPAAARRGSCRASATTPSPPCGARALRWSWPERCRADR